MNEEAAAVGHPTIFLNPLFFLTTRGPPLLAVATLLKPNNAISLRFICKKNTRKGASPPGLIDSRFFAESSRGSQSPAALEQVCRNPPFLAHYCLF